MIDFVACQYKPSPNVGGSMISTELDKIEEVMRGPNEPDTDWFVVTIEKLIAEVRESWSHMAES